MLVVHKSLAESINLSIYLLNCSRSFLGSLTHHPSPSLRSASVGRHYLSSVFFACLWYHGGDSRGIPRSHHSPTTCSTTATSLCTNKRGMSFSLFTVVIDVFFWASRSFWFHVAWLSCLSARLCRFLSFVSPADSALWWVCFFSLSFSLVLFDQGSSLGCLVMAT